MTPAQDGRSHLPTSFDYGRVLKWLNAMDLPGAVSYKLRWEQGLETSIEPDDWNKAWSSVAKCTFNTATLKAAYKVLLQWY